MAGAESGNNEQQSGGGAVRRRITRACDQCNALRTKCDGDRPCAHCSGTGLPCEYKRVRKKRGKASAKDQRRRTAPTSHRDQDADNQQRTSTASENSSTEPSHNTADGMRATRAGSQTSRASLPSMFAVDPDDANSTRMSAQFPQAAELSRSAGGPHVPVPLYNGHHNTIKSIPSYPHMTGTTSHPNADQLRLNDFGDVHSIMDPQAFDDLQASMGTYAPNPNSAMQNGQNLSSRYGMMSPLRRHTSHGSETFNVGLSGEAHVPGWLGGVQSGQSPGRFSIPSIPSPGAAGFPSQGPAKDSASFSGNLRYPVLRPVLPHITPIIPVTLACELLELYFTSSTAASLHPTSPYITGYVFRKRSFLHPTNPRVCSPALLSSMLWIAAQTSDASFLTASVTARGKVCQKLLELTIYLLKPLVHQPNSADDSSNTVINGVALGGFGVNVNLPLPGGRHSAGMAHYTGESSAEVDDIATYIHLATVISASEYKAASIRWWSVVWSLARELRFSRELPRTEDASENRDGAEDMRMETPSTLTEEAREERRRVWWLVYTVDRHLSLCYNQPLSLHDIECTSLLRPVPEIHWQAGDTYIGPPTPDTARPRGPSLECTDHSIFGFFTPLMTICGECIELQQARNHPRLGLGFRPQYDWDATVALIRGHLDVYAESLNAFRNQHLPEGMSIGSSTHVNPVLTESQVQTIIVLAYAEHIMHVMHVLLAGKWDPVVLLDDADMWISSDEFVTASNHAVEAAQALSPILEYDPDLSFIPWLFGIYLMHGSFLLLLFADKLGANADERYIGACERCVRAIEACVVTLNTEYQRNFRKVMRSALAQVRGRVTSDFGEQQFRRREVLAIYRWTGDGTGLAV